ncbi:MAG: RDD family protein, partial [Verrucomicrobia bacterium]|nr:RDD family protein [Verrucomicrobiota bacterium]
QYKMIGGDGREYGPASLEELRLWCEEGRLSRETLVWRGDEERWRPAADWEELKWDLPMAPVPEAPPIPDPGPEPRAEVVPAGFWIRAAAYGIDWVILSVLATLITLPWAEPLAQLQEQFWAQWKANTPDPATTLRLLLISLAINLPLGFAYFAGFHGARGATPGKQALGLHVVRDDGLPLGYGRAVLRHAAEILSGLLLGAGYLLAAVTPEKRALHDLLARTRVVRMR